MERIVVVGGRTAVQAHADRYNRFPGVTVCGVINTDESGDAAVPDVPEYESVARAIHETPIDGVDICGPGVAYNETIDDAINAGLPTRCDPPFTLEEPRFDALTAQTTTESGWLMVDSPHRFSRVYDRLRSSVEAGDIGAIGVARITRSAPFDGRGWNTSYLTASAVTDSVSALCAILAHDLDVLRWTFGAIERVFARARTSGRYNYAHTMLVFRDGGRATVETTWTKKGSRSPRVTVEYSGDHGRVTFTERDAATALRDETGSLRVDPPADDCRGRLLREFVARLRTPERQPAGIAPDDPSRVAVAVRRSIVEERPITLAEASL